MAKCGTAPCTLHSHTYRTWTAQRSFVCERFSDEKSVRRSSFIRKRSCCWGGCYACKTENRECQHFFVIYYALSRAGNILSTETNRNAFERLNPPNRCLASLKGILSYLFSPNFVCLPPVLPSFRCWMRLSRASRRVNAASAAATGTIAAKKEKSTRVKRRIVVAVRWRRCFDVSWPPLNIAASRKSISHVIEKREHTEYDTVSVY